MITATFRNVALNHYQLTRKAACMDWGSEQARTPVGPRCGTSSPDLQAMCPSSGRVLKTFEWVKTLYGITINPREESHYQHRIMERGHLQQRTAHH